MRNSEGVVLWTHDVGSGLVAPKTGSLTELGASANVKKAKGVTGNGAGNGEDVEVRSFPVRIAVDSSDPDERRQAIFRTVADSSVEVI